jgi:uncharacterized membrane protein YfcA
VLDCPASSVIGVVGVIVGVASGPTIVIAALLMELADVGVGVPVSVTITFAFSGLFVVQSAFVVKVKVLDVPSWFAIIVLLMLLNIMKL